MTPTSNKAAHDLAFPPETHDRKEFTFSREELSTMNSMATINQLGVLAEQLINNFLNSSVLPRVGVPTSADVRIIYELAEGKFYAYIPKKTAATSTPPAPAEDKPAS